MIFYKTILRKHRILYILYIMLFTRGSWRLKQTLSSPVLLFTLGTARTETPILATQIKRFVFYDSCFHEEAREVTFFETFFGNCCSVLLNVCIYLTASFAKTLFSAVSVMGRTKPYIDSVTLSLTYRSFGQFTLSQV